MGIRAGADSGDFGGERNRFFSVRAPFPALAGLEKPPQPGHLTPKPPSDRAATMDRPAAIAQRQVQIAIRAEGDGPAVMVHLGLVNLEDDPL